MSSLWAFLSKPNNQKVLSLIGTGIAALAAAVWAVLMYFSPSPHPSDASAHTNQVTFGSDSPIVKDVQGGNVTITVGPTAPKQ